MPLSRTTLRATEILNLLAARPDGMTISEISVELRMPKTSAFDIVQTLRQTALSAGSAQALHHRLHGA